MLNMFIKTNNNCIMFQPWSEVNDPMWSDMWYLNRRDDFNMMVEGAWNLGYSGLGVAVTILDDGIEKDHPDLIRNYDPLSSTDVNDNDSDPNPRQGLSTKNICEWLYKNICELLEKYLRFLQVRLLRL